MNNGKNYDAELLYLSGIKEQSAARSGTADSAAAADAAIEAAKTSTKSPFGQAFEGKIAKLVNSDRAEIVLKKMQQ